MENYSKKIRQKTKNYIDDVELFLNYFEMNSSLKYELFIESLKCNDDSQLIDFLKQYGLVSEKKQRETDFIKKTIYIQSYTDFYLMNRFHNKIEKNDSSFININYENVEKFFDDSDIYIVMLKSMEEFNTLSAYDKILLLKSLTQEENEMLKSINPFFEYEKNKYDVEITKELIIKQMNKWVNSFGLEKAINETSKFIFKLYDINVLNVNSLFLELDIIGEKDQISDEVINYNNLYVTKNNLNSKLREEYNNKQKIKK